MNLTLFLKPAFGLTIFCHRTENMMVVVLFFDFDGTTSCLSSKYKFIDQICGGQHCNRI